MQGVVITIIYYVCILIQLVVQYSQINKLPSSSTFGPCNRLGACLVSPKSGLLLAGASSTGKVSATTS